MLSERSQAGQTAYCEHVDRLEPLCAVGGKEVAVTTETVWTFLRK